MDDQNIKELICEVKYSNMNYAAKKLLIKMLEEKRNENKTHKLQ